MNEFNNLSVLPFYPSLSDQNARKWWVFGRVYPLFTPVDTLLPFQIMRPHRTNTITSFKVYTKDGALVGDYTTNFNSYVTIKNIDDYDVIIFTSQFPLFTNFVEGQYYAEIADGVQTWYSEIWTAVQDMSCYLKIQWWDNEDFIMDDGVIVYKNPSFKNTIYLQADVAKPEYLFEEEVEDRDGYTFPIKQISEKKYKFSFIASEYLLDVMRFIRMSDYVEIEYEGKTFNPDTFLITPEWVNEGDVATVNAEFQTNTVAKKLGVGYLRPVGGGDFNIDYNEDYNNPYSEDDNYGGGTGGGSGSGNANNNN